PDTGRIGASPTTQRACVPGVARQAGLSKHALVVTMVLALSWALGEATGLPHPTLTWMAATHGLGNALGFALCSALARQRLLNGAGSARTAPTRTVPLLTDPFLTDPEGRTS
ncbi:YndJ family transporter, partial [Streptomyces sp. NPDC048411]|uniref:YndJ family transporter n=1 Tax=Streptomyces sp. NPDC048411 TaxID=3157206 RepID=UPI003455E7CA